MLCLTTSRDHTLSITVPKARPISGISTAYATWLNEVDAMVSQRCVCDSVLLLQRKEIQQLD